MVRYAEPSLWVKEFRPERASRPAKPRSMSPHAATSPRAILRRSACLEGAGGDEGFQAHEQPEVTAESPHDHEHPRRPAAPRGSPKLALRAARAGGDPPRGRDASRWVAGTSWWPDGARLLWCFRCPGCTSGWRSRRTPQIPTGSGSRRRGTAIHIHTTRASTTPPRMQRRSYICKACTLNISPSFSRPGVSDDNTRTTAPR